MSTTGAFTGPKVQTDLFIDGKFVKAQDGKTAPTLNPHDGSTIADVAQASTLDVDIAVKAAQAAFP